FDKRDTREINTIQVTAKFDGDATIPSYKTHESAGMDLTPSENGVVPPFQTAAIPTGVGMRLRPGYLGLIVGRSSVMLAGKGTVLRGVIDSDYEGEIKIMVSNDTPKPLRYNKGGKATAQLIFLPHEQAESPEHNPVERKGGFGPTDQPMVNQITKHPR